MTNPRPKDGLLDTTRLLIGIVRVLAIIGMVLLGGIALVIPALGPEGLKDVGQGMTMTHAFTLSFMLLLAVAILVLLFKGLGLLRDIIDTVGAGDPFAPANADRLEKMGWYAASVIPMMVVIVGLAVWLKGVVENIELDARFDFGVVFLALVLFVLARVFRYGAEMRADLDDTV
ncbi:DUF2975 domain-containing protein [Sphingomicrobium sediminis]|uniref:DUF2975 domain-containing protein n=1 Tax=Sphingomicrobium sediminis TaxID=2950949 RepID=A0A9X2EG80_9SPHN|nr:DUF2975 domain-containing protein [Sphingomicrobium sediminis]MCM8557428.1 DUF2975 domain-containing protein [Sphingomicrobium sediminis]